MMTTMKRRGSMTENDVTKLIVSAIPKGIQLMPGDFRKTETGIEVDAETARERTFLHQYGFESDEMIFERRLRGESY